MLFEFTLDTNTLEDVALLPPPFITVDSFNVNQFSDALEVY